MGDLTIKQLQKQVDDWIKENGDYWPPLSILVQCQEELGELARVVNDLYGGRVKKLEDQNTAIGTF